MDKKMDITQESDEKTKVKHSPKLCGTNYPVSIAFIVVNEFCERFSYYGMKALLTLYFMNYLHWDKNLSTVVYHAFSSLCYFTPVLGAIIADSWLGKFRTIIYLSIVYVIGHVVKSVGAIPTLGDNTMHVVLSLTGLVLIAIGTGGIKPCVSAFGGDQFEEEHVEERRKFFSIFYMSINAGSVLSTIITPILRGDVQCFEGDCYALAFGVPAALMLIALVVFIAGSSLYKKSPPEGNVLLDVCRCMVFAVKNRWRSSKTDPKRAHWLDWAEEKFSKRLIQEIKMVLRVLLLYIPLPMFWALFDQQGSRWTLQATRMNLDFGPFVLKPDQMQMLNALLILVFIPIFDMGVYPLIGLCKINFTPLKKMAAGMILAALAFVAATIVEVNVIKTVVEAPPAGQSLLQILNLADGEVRVTISETGLFPEPIKPYEDPWEYQRLPLNGISQNHTVKIKYDAVDFNCVLSFHEQKAYSLILHKDIANIECKLVEDLIEKSEKGDAFVRFVNANNEGLNVTVGGQDFQVAPAYGISPSKSVMRAQYSDVKCMSDQNQYSLDLGLLDFGASYTVILDPQIPNGLVARKMEDVHANNVHIAWQVPQYALITAGEVMFSITGLEFSYSQAPANMKSVLQAVWLMTVAFGNVIVLIVAEGAGLQQWVEFVLFAALLVAVCLIFSIMGHFYTYVNPDRLDEMFSEDTIDDNEKNSKRHPGEEVPLKNVARNTKI
nr:solute carrier family 15 member 2-like isoform X1 [Paramormyrops kingsleyae]XP_023682685.1 solute carrier family 15 member 2-like isoform X1 [Paramormyrops kingsleyae]XP_023682686.1 solute carrier family 15 member 2-like isoform X1 [Paramormyrops kingsleyae]XP_023682688.1 solute carrier family 15 member 2-like isoform X1 [Paramormyrops kingsleyae]